MKGQSENMSECVEIKDNGGEKKEFGITTIKMGEQTMGIFEICIVDKDLCIDNMAIDEYDFKISVPRSMFDAMSMYRQGGIVGHIKDNWSNWFPGTTLLDINEMGNFDNEFQKAQM